MDVETQAGGEVHAGVDRLVAEIERAVGLIEHLRRENAELKQQRQALQTDVTRMESELSELRADRERLQNIYNDNAALIENRSEIQDKIEAMLSRLDALNYESNTDDA